MEKDVQGKVTNCNVGNRLFFQLFLRNIVPLDLNKLFVYYFFRISRECFITWLLENTLLLEGLVGLGTVKFQKLVCIYLLGSVPRGLRQFGNWAYNSPFQYILQFCFELHSYSYIQNCLISSSALISSHKFWQEYKFFVRPLKKLIK